MARLKYNDLNSAPEKSKPHLEATQKKLGSIPNIFKALANSPAALGTYGAINNALAESQLTPQIKESIALIMAETNSCQYCLSAHTLIGGKAGLSASDIASAREGTATDPKTKAILKLVKAILASTGHISDAEFNEAKTAGVTDGEFAEICAVIGLNYFTNLFNSVSQNDVDFPKVELRNKKAA